MDRRWRVSRARLVLVFALAVGWVVVASGVANADVDSVVLISWDGVQRVHLLELLSEGRLPALARLIEDGAFISLEITDHATDTKAGHAEMLTGLSPDVTGVCSDSIYQAIPAGLTLFERLKQGLGADGIATAAITGKSSNLSEILANALPAIDMSSMRTANADAVGDRSLDALERFRDRTFFAFFHFRDPDVAGHWFGENSGIYEDALVACDAWLDRILATLDGLEMRDRTAIYVTTDHGFDEGARTHNFAPDVWLACSEPVRMPFADEGDQRDIAATVLARFGINAQALSPSLPGVVYAVASPTAAPAATP